MSVLCNEFAWTRNALTEFFANQTKFWRENAKAVCSAAIKIQIKHIFNIHAVKVNVLILL
jgi:hypothetical protein